MNLVPVVACVQTAVTAGWVPVCGIVKISKPGCVDGPHGGVGGAATSPAQYRPMRVAAQHTCVAEWMRLRLGRCTRAGRDLLCCLVLDFFSAAVFMAESESVWGFALVLSFLFGY